MSDDEAKRPYAAVANVMAVIERCRTRNLPETIDDDLFRIAGIGPAVFGRVKQSLQFLNLIRADGTSTDTLRAISKAPELEYRRLLEGAVRDAYADDFGQLDPEQDSQLQVFDAFRKYEPRSQTNRMVMLFLGLCREAGIPVKDAPRERKMQTASGVPRAKVPARRSTSVRGANAKPDASQGNPNVRRTDNAPGMLFGFTEDDVAALDEDEFQTVWAALGKVARARARKRTEEALKDLSFSTSDLVDGPHEDEGEDDES